MQEVESCRGSSIVEDHDLFGEGWKGPRRDGDTVVPVYSFAKKKQLQLSAERKYAIPHRLSDPKDDVVEFSS